MRYLAPSRETVDPVVFTRQPLLAWREHAALLQADEWPSIATLNMALPVGPALHFAAQTAALLADGRHYEQRIAECGAIATRQSNWHDLLNALVWSRYPAIKRALNQRQVAEIGRMGPKERSRPQYAMTHFDEAGVIVAIRDPALLALWDQHDWHGLFWRHRAAWLDGTIELAVFGHALLEHALSPDKLLVGKALVFLPAPGVGLPHVRDACAAAIASGQLLHDPLDLRPLPLAGIPGWRADNAQEAFHLTTACYQPRRADRQYPAAVATALP